METIPRVIHYCWFGRGQKPELALRCIDSWHKYLPDCEIREWNEDNFDVNSTNYTREAYADGRYTFVSDYARYVIMEREGGIYFDTDVELIRPIDDLLAAGPFMGCEADAPAIRVNSGLAMALLPQDPVCKVLKDIFIKSFFNPDNPDSNRIAVDATTRLFKARGLSNGKRGAQTVDGITLYPTEFFNPLDPATGRMRKTDATRSIHWYSTTWHPRRNSLRARTRDLIHLIFGKDIYNNLRRFMGQED